MYALYVDDSGTKEYAIKPEDYNRAGNSRYFVFGGVLLTTVESGVLSQKIKNLKQAVFGTEDVEIKSNWLRIPKETEKRYKKPFGVSDESLTAFVSEFYDLIGNCHLQLCASVVDKIHVQEDYKDPWYAPALAYEFLLQRIVQEVRSPERVSIIVDNMTGATPKGNQYRKNLEAHHTKLLKHGSSLIKKLDFSPVVPGIRFVDSSRVHLIQVADVVAYNVYRQFVDHGDSWESGATGPDGKVSLPTYK
jgi:hypothetical protein